MMVTTPQKPKNVIPTGIKIDQNDNDQDQTVASPLFKWVGGKKWLVPLLTPTIRSYLDQTRGHYVEPFLGGGAIAFALGLPKMILGDCCQPLITAYKVICKSPQAVAWGVQTLVEKGVDKEAYLKVRATTYPSPVMAAARFVYLNVNCFNGLYRENSKGIFNTPHGTTANGSPRGGYPTTAEYELAANVLKTCNIATRDFTDTIGLATEGDFLYCDSPYLDTFSNYTAEGFGEDDHVELAAALREAAANGVAVVASNSDTARVHELYDWAHVESLTEQHMVGSTGARRGARNAVLIASDRKLLQGIG